MGGGMGRGMGEGMGGGDGQSPRGRTPSPVIRQRMNVFENPNMSFGNSHLIAVEYREEPDPLRNGSVRRLVVGVNGNHNNDSLLTFFFFFFFFFHFREDRVLAPLPGLNDLVPLPPQGSQSHSPRQ